MVQRGSSFLPVITGVWAMVIILKETGLYTCHYVVLSIVSVENCLIILASQPTQTPVWQEVPACV